MSPARLVGQGPHLRYSFCRERQNVVGESHWPDLLAALLLMPASVRLGVLPLQARAPEMVLPATSGGGKAPLCSTGP